MRPRILRPLAAVLLVAEAVLIVNPVLSFSNFVTGAQIAGKAIAQMPIADVIGQGVAATTALTTSVLLLLAAWGIAHSTRGIGALILQIPVLTYPLIPFLRPMTTTEPMILLLVAVACVALLIVIIGTSAKNDGKHRRWWWLAVVAVAAVALAGVGARSTSLPFNPTGQLATQATGQASTAEDMPAPDAPQNPRMAANPFNSIHNDAWASDAYDLPAPSDPAGAAVESLFTGGDCSTMTFDSRGRLITLCSTLTRVVGYIVDPDSLQVIDSQIVGQRKPDLTDFSGGGYFFLDAKDRVVYPARGGTIQVLDTVNGFREAASYNVAPELVAGEQVTSVLPDWAGRYWFVGSLGTVGVVRPNGQIDSLNLGGEDIENSFAITREGAYVVTGAALYRLVVGPSGPPVEAWRTPYDRGSAQKPGQSSRASGTTPTVFGDYVAITDNAEPRMNVVVAKRLTGDVVCTEPVFADGASADENSLIAIDDMVIAENNYGYHPAITSVMGGQSTQPGLAGIAVRPDGCETKWSNDTIRIPSLVSKATSRGAQVLTYTKPVNRWGVDTWYFTGVDARTGEVLWTRLAGTGSVYNNHYAAGYLSEDGDMFVGTVNGLVVLRNR